MSNELITIEINDYYDPVNSCRAIRVSGDAVDYSLRKTLIIEAQNVAPYNSYYFNLLSSLNKIICFILVIVLGIIIIIIVY